MNRIKPIPSIISKTCLPKTWHIPYIFHDINPEAIEDIQVQKILNTKKE